MPKSHDDGIDDSNVLLLLVTMGLLCLRFQQRKCPLPTKVQLSFLPFSVVLSSLLVTYSALFGWAVIFPEPALECVTFTTSSELAGSGLRFAARTLLLDKAVYMSAVNAFGL